MQKRNRLLRIAVGAVLSLCLQPQSVAATGPPTLAQALRNLGITPDEPNLRVALNDTRPAVRSLAAAELAELKAVPALPAILHAAEREQQDLVQAQMYESALALGSPLALPPLRVICQEPTYTGQARLVAARAVFSTGDHACFAAIAALMLPDQPADDRIGAWYLLAQLRARTAQETDLVSRSLQIAIAESNPRIRLEASSGIRFLGDPSGIAALRNAVAAEPEADLRSFMEQNLAALLEQQHRSAPAD